MREENYRGCLISSNPFQSKEYGYNFVENRVIKIYTDESVTDIPVDHLQISENEWVHITEAKADEVFAKSAKLLIDARIR